MLRRLLEVTSKAAAILVASSVFVAAHATAPRLTAEELAMCADNNPWVKTGYCERNNAWNMSRCLCPKENATGGGGTEIASTEPEDHCGTKGRGKYTFKSFKTFTYKSTPKFTYVH
jgi:hypothetical protein